MNRLLLQMANNIPRERSILLPLAQRLNQIVGDNFPGSRNLLLFHVYTESLLILTFQLHFQENEPVFFKSLEEQDPNADIQFLTGFLGNQHQSQHQ